RTLRAVAILVGAALLAPAAAAAPDAPVDKHESMHQMAFGVKMALNGSWNEAAFRFGKAVQADPGNAFAQNDLGVALESTGQFDRAAAAYAKALELEPGSAKIRENRDRLKAYLDTVKGQSAAPAKPVPAASPVQAAPPADHNAPARASGGGS